MMEKIKKKNNKNVHMWRNDCENKEEKTNRERISIEW